MRRVSGLLGAQGEAAREATGAVRPGLGWVGRRPTGVAGVLSAGAFAGVVAAGFGAAASAGVGSAGGAASAI